MNERVPLAIRGRNPDILTCIADLSNDEVFTPPVLAQQMLDLVGSAWAESHDGASIWADPTVRFLDPFTKSGVFLREITARLVMGLAPAIPDLQERVNHILTKQVFGIAVTELTALLARRTLYCSKWANGPHSVATAFANPHGKIWFERMEHSWKDESCEFCGAPKSIFNRDQNLENHAYAFIHTDDIQTRIAELFGETMQFDVIIGNPPYQMTGGAGGTSDSSIYHLFVEQALALEPRLLTMVIPSRWLAGGRGMGDFRKAMLGDRHLKHLIDYPVASEVFPGVELKAGVCYFLWDASHSGDCSVTMTRGGTTFGPIERDLGEYDVFVRDARAVSVLKKVLKFKERPVSAILTRDTPFGLSSNFNSFDLHESASSIPVYYIRKMKRSVGYIERSIVLKNPHLIDSWKVLVPEAFNGGDGLPHQILGRAQIAPAPSACTQSFLAFYVGTQDEAISLQSYYITRFFRFLVSLRKITQHALASTYTWVPLQQWDRIWTDDELYDKYGITAEEQAFIASQVKTMILDGADDE
jgi:site-specific DNA-methyltransferase (adenine-specific)